MKRIEIREGTLSSLYGRQKLSGVEINEDNILAKLRDL